MCVCKTSLTVILFFTYFILLYSFLLKIECKAHFGCVCAIEVNKLNNKLL